MIADSHVDLMVSDMNGSVNSQPIGDNESVHIYLG